MNNKQRIINTVLAKPVDRVPYFCYFGPWGETLERWEGEGLGRDASWAQCHDFDSGFTSIQVNLGYEPAFEYQVIKDEGHTIIARDRYGIVSRSMKHGATIPQYLEYPVVDRQSWERLKQRLNPHDPARFPEDWKALAAAYNASDAVIQIGDYPYGLFGTLRDMFGVESLLYLMYDDCDLLTEIMQYLTDFWIEIWRKVAKDVRIDAIHMWEDLSGIGGPLISPAMIREMMVPCYSRMKAFCTAHDIPIFSLDTDGNVKQIVQPFMEGGVNLLFPFEVQAGCDVNSYLKQYPALCCMGGINKRALAISKEAIDAELARIAPAMVSGHYIPQLDHLIHPEVPWENFVYFCERLKHLCGK